MKQFVIHFTSNAKWELQGGVALVNAIDEAEARKKFNSEFKFQIIEICGLESEMDNNVAILQFPYEE